MSEKIERDVIDPRKFFATRHMENNKTSPNKTDIFTNETFVRPCEWSLNVIFFNPQKSFL